METERDVEDLLEKNAIRLRALCEAMQRKGKATLLEEKLADILVKNWKNEGNANKQKGAA
jgi:hypothetical protein